MPFSAKQLYKYLLSGIKKDKELYFLDEYSLRYASAKILTFVTTGLVVLSIILNIFEGNFGLIIPLGIVLAVVLPNFYILHRTKNGLYVLVSTAVILIIFGAYLILIRSMPDGSSLFWFLLFPPMLMFCVGLRLGSRIFFFFYIFLFVVLLTPMDFLLANNHPMSFRIRFLAAMMGIFIFSWLAEFVRLNTQQALAQAARMLERHALTDPLTTLGNRRDFQNYFVTSQAQSVRSNRDFSLALVDIDFFKKVNDTYGHPVGDIVLCHIAAIMASQLRVADRLFRWGGEEFVILMPETNAEEARRVAERLRSAVEKTPYIFEGGTIALTVSIGLHSGCSTDDIDGHMAIADENLYKAKKADVIWFEGKESERIRRKKRNAKKGSQSSVTKALGTFL